MNYKTHAFLRMCRLLGYSKIGINQYDSDLPNCEFCKSSQYVCATPNIKYDGYDTPSPSWPGIWWVAAQLNVYYGCGNGQQCQVIHGSLDAGIYDLATIKL